MSVITRFAPSPTGFLHVGNARTALITWIFARANNGKFILRIDDTDIERSKQEYVDAIKEDLSWLGLDWDQEVVQSQRMDRYTAAKERMIKDGRLYPCYETAEELQIKKKLLLGQNKPPIYDRSALNLSNKEKEAIISQGISPHYRFLLSEGKIEWDDLIRGHLTFETKNLSDPVLIRGDGSMTYSIASVIDDIEFQISHIIRGEDHITNSAIHIQLFKAMEAPVPSFAHTSLLKSKDGGISKRDGGFEIRALREEGYDKMAILSLLAKMGTSDSISPSRNLEELIEKFSLSKQSKSTVTYDISDISRLNAQIIHNQELSDVADDLKNMGVDNITEDFWISIRSNISNIRDVKDWYSVCCTKIAPTKDDMDYRLIASDLLPEGEFANDTWEKWMTAVKAKTGRSGKELFMPIRRALTNMDHGPELRRVLVILGRDRVYKRLIGLEA